MPRMERMRSGSSRNQEGGRFLVSLYRHLRLEDRRTRVAIRVLSLGLVVIAFVISPLVGQLSATAGTALATTLTLVFVLLILDHVIELKGATGRLEVFASEEDAAQALKDFVQEEKPSSVKMLEYSTASIGLRQTL